MAYYGDMKTGQAARLSGAESPQSAPPSNVLDLMDIKAEETRPLTKQEEKLQASLQKKADADFVSMNFRHPEDIPDSFSPPQIVLIGTRTKFIGGLYDPDENKFYMTVDAAKDGKLRDFVLDHEISHKFDRGDTEDEHRSDIRAAEILGPKKAIKGLHRFHKVAPINDSHKAESLDLLNHGRTIVREQRIKDASHNQKLKLPKHSAKILNAP